MGERDGPGGRGRGRDAELTDELVLAAARRAALHRGRTAVALRELREHLGIAPRSGAAAELRERVAGMEREQLLLRRRAHGVSVWALAPRGRRLLAAARARCATPTLGESPQHAAWRRARMLARIEIGRLGADLRDTLCSCQTLLALLQDGPPGRAPSSDEWFELAERLRRDCRRLGSAQYCLREWQEPDEEHADIDDLRDAGDAALGSALPAVRARRAGRRNTSLWGEPD
ncbi:MAG: hypothetical protein ACYDC2_02450 [Solirubrobacteraceae bacterium]